jgi:diacylglycerol O-acyltransferase / wax synthase
VEVVVERLSAIDAALIHGEMPEWHGHVTSLLVLDPASMPTTYRFEWFRAALAARLAGVARFGQRVAATPLGVDRPVWIDDGGFDAEHHIKRLVLGDAGTIEHLFSAAGEVAGHQLRHDRPLWECYVVETRRGRLRALIVKNHHALFDGVGGLESVQAMFDVSAAAAGGHGEPVSPRPPCVRSAKPGAVDMLLRSAVRALVVQPAESVKVAHQLIRQALPVGRAVLSGDRPVLGLDAPRNPFAGWISPERTVSGAQLSMEQMKAVRHRANVKLNDVLLAVVGGALRRYLVARHGVSGPSLVANVAVSTRAADEKADSSNKFSVMFATLGTAISDPVMRLSAIHDSSVKAKRLTEALRTRSDISVVAAAPPILVSGLAQLCRAAGLHRRISLIGNVGVSNVPGPAVQLFVGGAAVSGMFVFGPLMLNSVINFTAVSNSDSLDVGVASSPGVIPDIDELARLLQPALDELTASLGCR